MYGGLDAHAQTQSMFAFAKGGAGGEVVRQMGQVQYGRYIPCTRARLYECMQVGEVR